MSHRAAFALFSILLAAPALAGEASLPQTPQEDTRHDRPDVERDRRPPAMPVEPAGELDSVEARTRDWLRRHGDRGVVDPDRMRRLVKEEYERTLREPRLAQPFGISGTTWSNIGPTNIAGRVRSIATHPTAAGTAFIGTASGGVWKTTDTGATYTPLTEGIADLSVGAVAVAPSNANIIYLGSGEPVGSGIPGIGFLASNDGGATWTFPGTGVLATAFWQLSVHPTTPADVNAGTIAGGFRSTDGGQHWTPWTVPAGTPGQITDIVRSPASATTLYAAAWSYGTGVKVIKSTDGGSTWSDFSTGLPTSTNATRIALAIDSTGTVLYAGFSISGTAYVYKSTSGAAWVGTAAVSNLGLHFGQASYNNVIAVAPGGSSTVLFCGSVCTKSTTGGASWAAPAFATGGYHVDFHALRYDAGGTLFIGNDGGVYTSTDTADTSTNRTAGLVSTQFYAIGNDVAGGVRVFGGMQDNGSARRTAGTTWSFLTSSDGMSALVHAEDPRVAWTSNQMYNGGNHLWRTKDSANTTSNPLFIQLAPPFPSGESTSWMTLLAPDPQNPSVLYTNTTRLWKSATGGDVFYPLPTTTNDASTWNTADAIDSIAIAKSDSRIIAVSKGWNVFRSIDGGTTWALTSTGLPGYYVNSIDIDPTNPNMMYAALSRTNGPTLYYTTNGGQSWSARATGLPSFAAQVVRVDPTDSLTLYCGTDVGVYRSIDQGTSWFLFGTGLPRVSVYDLRILQDGTVLRAGTYGRGVWDLQIPASTNNPPAVSITTAAATIALGSTVAFTGSATDPDADPMTIAWLFPDTWERTQSTAGGSQSVSHTFTRAGIWPVSLSARDSHGAVSSATVVMTVNENGDSCTAPITISNASLPVTVVANSETWAISNPLSEPVDPTPSCSPWGASYALPSTGWFLFTAPSTASYDFTTCGSTYDTTLSAYTGSCGALVQIAGACNDDIDPYGTAGCANGGSKITVSLTAGQTIRLLVTGKYYYTSQGVVNLTARVTSTTTPSVTRVATIAGPSTGGTPVALYGTNFLTGASVTFGGTPATSVTVSTPSTLTAVTPAHAAGAVDVAVTNPATAAGVLTGGFTYLPCTFALSAAGTSIAASSTSGSFTVTASGGCGWTANSNAAWLTSSSAGIGNGSVSFFATQNTTGVQRIGVITVGNQTYTVTQSGVVSWNLVATAASTTSVGLTWSATTADHYEVWRNSGSGWVQRASPTTNFYTDPAPADNVFLYKVRAIDSMGGASAYSTPDVANTLTFTDDPITVGSTVIKAVHMDELRRAVNLFRAAAGVIDAYYTDPTLTGVPVKLIHFTELRSDLDQARTFAAMPPLSYSTISTTTPITATSIMELRDALK